MKTFFILVGVLAVVFVAIPGMVEGQNKKPTTTSNRGMRMLPEDFVIRPGVGVGRVLIGSSKSEVLSLLGNPVAGTNTWGAFSGPSGRSSLSVSYDGGTVSRIDITGSKFHTVGGLTAVSGRAAFLKTFPTTIKCHSQLITAIAGYYYKYWDAASKGIALLEIGNIESPSTKPDRILIVHGINQPFEKEGECKLVADQKSQPLEGSNEIAVNKVLSDAGILFNEGLLSYQGNRRSDAGAKFDKSVETFLYSTLSIRREPKLQGCYNQLVETIYRMEFPSDTSPPRVGNLSQTCGWTIDKAVINKVEFIAKESAVTKPGFNTQTFDPSPLDDLSRFQLTAEEESPNSKIPAAPLAHDRIRVPASTKLSFIAAAAGTTVQYLREINPELRDNITPSQPSILNVPAGKANEVGAVLRRTLGIVLTVTAKAGDTVTKVAERYGANPVEVAKYNGLLPNSVLGAGREIKIP